MKHINAGGEGHKAGCGAMWVDVTYLWDEVTCPECLKLRPTRKVSQSKLMILAFIFTLSVMACGMSAGTLPAPKVSTNVQAPSLEPAPTPIRAVTESPAFACGGLWVRYGAGVEYGVAGFALKGDTLYRTDAEPRTLDLKDGGGTWVQVVDRDGLIGWVNQRFLCGGEK